MAFTLKYIFIITNNRTNNKLNSHSEFHTVSAVK